MADHLIEARWLPGYPVDTPSGRLEPGGIYLITAGEADESDHWEPVKPFKPVKES